MLGERGIGEPFSGNCAKKLVASKTRFDDNQVKKLRWQKNNQAVSSVLETRTAGKDRNIRPGFGELNLGDSLLIPNRLL
ncbi:hypothetical protein [Moorena sp. SIO3H5]|uniref:hypothetical protein n=1 Tax=Moorena sp. SIO3H5 TaxID=2607834 RepID=UPI0013BCFAE3|nr:hypothetical protein [Moorena sp. SIO3H5]NEO72355.1 hypothetical protein [Moorena sp. SIO3H5]